MLRIIFDLDGTITSAETLPVIAKHFGIENDINKLTEQTVAGNVPFVESFIKRVHMMSNLPVDEIDNLLENITLYSRIEQFIDNNIEKCMIATGNLDCWVNKLCKKIGCKSYTSKAKVEENHVIRLTNILKKEAVVKEYQNRGDTVVFIGEGNNDLEAMRQADISLACGLTHKPANAVLGIVDYVVYEEETLCRQLNQLLSVVQE